MHTKFDIYIFITGAGIFVTTVVAGTIAIIWLAIVLMISKSSWNTNKFSLINKNHKRFEKILWVTVTNELLATSQNKDICDHCGGWYHRNYLPL
jgi:uncharacterized membrane protein